jgi:hypothetical protein
MPPSKLKRDEVTVRRIQLLKLRRQGVRYDDERILALGYTSPNSARRDLHRALEEHRDEEAAEASIYRQQENERLDALLEAAWPRATQPHLVFNKDREVVGEEIDMRAVDTVLRLMDRRAKLNGLDMPIKNEIAGPDGGAIPLGGTLAELNALIDTAGETASRADGPTVPAEDEDDDSDG